MRKIVMPASPADSFPPFQLDPDERRLSTGGLPLKPGGRALDTRPTRIERRERTVSI